MSDVVDDPAFRVHKIRLWCETAREHGDDNVATKGTGHLCGFQFLYKHETTGKVVRGSVTGDADSHGLKLVELLLYPGEHVTSVKGVNGVLDIRTNFCRDLSCLMRGGAVHAHYVVNRGYEIRALYGDGGRNHWAIWIQDAVQSTRTTLSPAATARYLDITNAWETLVQRSRSAEVENLCKPTLVRLFTVHGVLTAIEARKLVATGSVSPRLSPVRDLFVSYVRKITRARIWPQAKPSLSGELEVRLSELERDVDGLLRQEVTTGFNAALQRNNVESVRTIIQSRIEASKLDDAARLCFQAFTSMDLKAQVAEIVYEARGIRHESYFEHARRAAAVAEALEIVPDLRSDGRTALHVAAERHFFNLVEVLLVHCRVDPLVRDHIGHNRPIDLVGTLTDAEHKNEEVQRIHFLLEQCGKAKEFRLRTTCVLRSGVVTQKALEELLPCMTAVQDLQVIIGLGVANLEISALRLLLHQAFECVIKGKLVFDIDAAAYFKCGLEKCFTKGYLTKFELEQWLLRTTQVNMESAPWVTEIKVAIQKIQSRVVTLETNTRILKTHFESLRQALLDKEQKEQQRAYRQKMVSLLTLGLSWVCGPLVEVVINGVMDLTDPLHLLSATFELLGPDAVANFCASDGADAVFRKGIEAILARSDIEPFDFVSVLKDAVILEHPEYAVGKSVGSLENLAGAHANRSSLSANQLNRSARVSSTGSGRHRSSSMGSMSEVACDPAFRVHKVRFWCEAQGANDEADGYGYLCGFQFLYKHETTGAVVRGPVTGEADALWETLAELLLFPGEHLNSIKSTDGLLEISTNFCRGICCMLRGQIDDLDVVAGHNTEIRALCAEGDRNNWSISVHEAVRSTRVALPASTTARYLDIEDACNRLRARVAPLTSEPWVEQWFDGPPSDRLDARLFQIHGVITNFEARQLVATRGVEVELYKTIALIHGLLSATSSPATKANSADFVENKLAELDRLTQDLYDQEEAHGLSIALEQGNAVLVRAVIQSRIESRLRDQAARICVRAIGAVDVKDQVIELIFEIFKVRDEIAFINARGKATIAEALANMPGYPEGHSALHLAAADHVFQVIEPLLVHCRVDPIAQTYNGKSRPIDLVGPLRDHEANNEEVHRVLFLLDQCAKARELQQRAAAILGARATARTALEELFPFMTAVQDLQVITSLGASSLEADEFQQMLKAAFQYVVDSKLLFENEAVEYFQTGLEHCYAKGYVTKRELEDWGLRISHVDVRVAPWVPETTRTVQHMQPPEPFLEATTRILKTHFSELCLQLYRTKDQQQKRQHCRKLLPLIALALGWVGGAVLKERLGGMMDLGDPLRLTTATLELADDAAVVRLCASDSVTADLRQGVEAILERSKIQAARFVAVLKEAVMLEYPELHAGDKVAQLTSKSKEKVVVAIRAQQPPATSSSPRKEEATRFANPNEPEHPQRVEDGECALTAQEFEAQRLEAFPYHYAIQESGGSLEEFLELLKYVEQDGYDVNQAHEVIVKADATSKYQRMTLPPYVFASYLGFVDIVNHFWHRKDFKPSGEWKVVTMRRALKAAMASQVA